MEDEGRGREEREDAMMLRVDDVRPTFIHFAMFWRDGEIDSWASKRTGCVVRCEVFGPERSAGTRPPEKHESAQVLLG